MQQEQYALHSVIEEKHWWFVGRRAIMRQVVATAVPPSRSATVVDIGCGTGANIAALANDYSCVGVDSSPQAVALAQSRFANVRFICGQVPEDVGPLMSEARLCLLMDVLEHVADDFAFLSRLLASQEPGAHLLLTVPADPALWSPHDVSFGHYRRYDATRLARVWEGLPVTVRLLSYFNSRLYPIVRMVRAINRWRGRASGAAETDFRIPSPPMNWMLQRIFTGEASALLRTLDRSSQPGYARGVSLMALLRREPGTIAARSKPSDLPPDSHDPARSS